MSFLSNLFGKSKKNLPESLSPSAPAEKPSPEPARGGTTLRKADETPPERKAGPELSALEMAKRQSWEVKSLPVWKPGDEILGLYRVEEVIETGGMGRVYIAHHKSWNVKLAIKSPNEMMLSDRNNFARVLREANSWTELGLHPNIAYCYYVRSIEDVPHIFVEYVDGGNLRQWITEGKCIDYRVSLDLAIQFCHGMEHAHSKGMIHRDIKPENVLLTKDGILKVTDFGLVRTGAAIGDGKGKAGASAKGMTRLGDVMGTEGFMAPEQFTDAAGVDERADIFAFGVCLYEMCCGARPYDITIGERKKAPDPVSLSRDKKFPPALSEVLTKCVQWERDKRYGTFKEIRERLNSIYRDLFNQESPYAELKLVDLRADGLNNRAISYLELGKDEDAVNCWKEALAADPLHLESTFNYGYYRWNNGQPYLEVLEAPMAGLAFVHEHNPDYWRYLAWLHWERGDVDAIAKLQGSPHKVIDPVFLEALEDPDGPGKMVRVFEGHSNCVRSVAFSPDGKYALSGSGDRTLRLWDIATGREVQRFEGHTDFVNSVAFFPCGNFALSGSADKTIRLWDIATGREVRRFEGHNEIIMSVALSPDGKHALSGSRDRTVRLWDIATGRGGRRFEGHTEFVNCVAYSPDGKYTLSGSKDKTLRLWDIATGKEIRRFEGHISEVYSAAISSDGKYALSGSEDKTLRLWDIATGKEIREFERHISEVYSTAISSDGKYALSTRWDQTLRLWDISTGREVGQFEGHTDFVNSVVFSPDGKYALSGSEDKTVRLWNVYSPVGPRGGAMHYPVVSLVRSSRQLAAEKQVAEGLLASAESAIKTRKFSMAYRFVRQAQTISGYERDKAAMELCNACGIQGNAQRTGLRDGWWLRKMEGHSDWVNSVTFSPDGKCALSGSKDKTLRLWDIATGREVRRFEGHSGLVNSVTFSPGGKYALSGSKDKTLRLWEIATGKEIRRFEGHTNFVNSVLFSPDGKYALSGSEDKTLRLWDIATGREVRRFEGHSDAVISVAISPDGNHALSGGEGLRLWDIGTGMEIWQFKEALGPGKSVVFLPQGKYAMSAHVMSLSLWDIRTGEKVRRFDGHSDWVNSVAISPDGKYALSGSGLNFHRVVDNTLRLWDITTGEEIRRFEGHSDSVESVAFSPDGKYALSGSEDKTLRLWELNWDWEFPDGETKDQKGPLS